MVSQDIYRDGYNVYTTLNLDYQQKADELISEGLITWNKRYQENIGNRMTVVDEQYVPVIDLLSLAFNIDDIRIAGSQEKIRAKDEFYEDINPVMDVMSLMFGLDDLNYLSQYSYNNSKKKNPAVHC